MNTASLSSQVSKQFKDVYFGGNWTATNLRDHVKDLEWKEATQELNKVNSIATLVYHIHYFVKVQLRVFEGHPLEGNDRLSFDHPPIHSADDWNAFLDLVFREGELYSAHLESLPEHIWNSTFVDEKYGTYWDNVIGLIEHTHYHLGQIALLKKVLRGN
jgi:uncharacterized damage-inducible protein DinB